MKGVDTMACSAGSFFARQLGVLLLELRRAEITERGMQTLRVVDLIDEVRKVGGDILHGFIVHQVDGLDLKRLHEALGSGIVIWIASPAHRTDQPMASKELTIRSRGVLRSAIGMMDTARRRLPPSDCRPQRCHRQARVDRAADRIADDTAGPSIEDHGNVDEAGKDRDVSQIGDPKLFGPSIVIPFAKLERSAGHDRYGWWRRIAAGPSAADRVHALGV